jgi:outer membrane lipoprotein-sorting protein
MKKIGCLLLCLMWLMPQVSAQNTNTLDQVFAKIDEVAKTFESVQANVERTHVTVIVNDKDVSSGKFYYVRQSQQPRVRMDLSGPAQHSGPAQQQLLIDKGKLQIYYPNLKQVQEALLGEHQDKVEMFMALGFGQSSRDLKQNFTVSLAGEEMIDGKKTTVLELKPKNSTMFQSVRLWMDPQKWVSVQIKTTEQGSGDYLTIKFSDIKINPRIPESTFDLKLPKDVKVLKM